MLCNRNFSSNFTKRKRRPYRHEQANRQTDRRTDKNKCKYLATSYYGNAFRAGLVGLPGFNNNRRLIKWMQKVSNIDGYCSGI